MVLMRLLTLADNVSRSVAIREVDVDPLWKMEKKGQIEDF